MSFARRSEDPPDDILSATSKQRPAPHRQANGRAAQTPHASGRTTPTRQQSVSPVDQAGPNPRRRATPTTGSPGQKVRGPMRNPSANAIAAGVQDKASSSAWPLGPGMRSSPEMKRRGMASSTGSLTASALRSSEDVSGAVGSRTPASSGRQRSSGMPSNSPQRGVSSLPLPLPVNSMAPLVTDGERQAGFESTSNDANGNEKSSQEVGFPLPLVPTEADLQNFSKVDRDGIAERLAELSVQDISAALINFGADSTQGQRSPTPGGGEQQTSGSPLMASYFPAQGARPFTPVRDTTGQEPLNVSIELGQELVRRNRLLDREVRKLREMAGISSSSTMASADEMSQVEMKEMPIEWHVARGKQQAQELHAVCNWADEAGKLQRYVCQVLLNALQPESSVSQDARQALVKLVAFPPPPAVRSYFNQSTNASEADLASEMSNSAHLRLEVERRLERLGAEVQARGTRKEQLQAVKERADQAEKKIQSLGDCLALIAKLVPGGESLPEDVLVEKVKNVLEERYLQNEHLTFLNEKAQKAEHITKDLVAKLVGSANSIFEGMPLPPELLALQEAVEQLDASVESAKPSPRPAPAPNVVAVLEAASAVLESATPTPAASPAMELREALMAPYSTGPGTSEVPEGVSTVSSSSPAAQLAGVICGSRRESPVYQARVLTTEDISYHRKATPPRTVAAPVAVHALPAAIAPAPLAAIPVPVVPGTVGAPPMAIAVPTVPGTLGGALARSPSPGPRRVSRSPSPSSGGSRSRGAAVCACGNVFMLDSNYCRKCGAKRVKEAGQALAVIGPPPKVTIAMPTRQNSSLGARTPQTPLTPAPGPLQQAIGMAVHTAPRPVVVNGSSAVSSAADANGSAGSPSRYTTPTGQASRYMTPTGQAAAADRPMIVTERVEATVPDTLQSSQTRFPPWQFSEVSLIPNEKLPRPLVSNVPAMTRSSDKREDSASSSGSVKQAYPRSFQAPTTTRPKRPPGTPGEQV